MIEIVLKDTIIIICSIFLGFILGAQFIKYSRKQEKQERAEKNKKHDEFIESLEFKKGYMVRHKLNFGEGEVMIITGYDTWWNDVRKEWQLCYYHCRHVNKSGEWDIMSFIEEELEKYVYNK